MDAFRCSGAVHSATIRPAEGARRPGYERRHRGRPRWPVEPPDRDSRPRKLAALKNGDWRAAVSEEQRRGSTPLPEGPATRQAGAHQPPGARLSRELSRVWRRAPTCHALWLARVRYAGSRLADLPGWRQSRRDGSRRSRPARPHRPDRRRRRSRRSRPHWAIVLGSRA